MSADNKTNTSKTKTIYYAIIQELEVPAGASDEEIDDIVFKQLEQPVDYIWSENPDLFDFDKDFDMCK